MTAALHPKHPFRNVALFGAVAVWVLVVCVGLKLFVGYKITPGVAAVAPSQWPRSSLPRVADQSTLVMFVHPRCPCTRASLAELDAIMRLRAAQAFVVFMRPDGAKPGWERTDSWDSAGRIPHTTRVIDEGGLEAKRFGAATSGQLVVYDPNGHLVFAGGITDSRGHLGDNVGRRTVVELLAQHQARHEHPVFGCPLASVER